MDYGQGVARQIRSPFGASQQNWFAPQFGGKVPPQPSDTACLRHVGGVFFVQQAFWKHTWPAPQFFVTGVQTPLRHSFLVVCVPVQV